MFAFILIVSIIVLAYLFISSLFKSSPRKYAEVKEVEDNNNNHQFTYMNNANFIAIDFETATTSTKMPCQVGIVVVKNGVITEKISRFIQPPGNRYSQRCIDVHGITPADTKEAPSFPEVWKEIGKYFSANFIVAHNASFDIDVLRRVLDRYNMPFPILMGVGCTYELSGLSLEKACSCYGVPLASHHDALSDATAAAELFLKYLNGEFSFEEIQDEQSYPTNTAGYSKEWHETHVKITGDLLKKDLSNADPNNPFYDKKVVITGIFWQERKELARIIKSMGADIDTSITARTKYVLVGEDAGPKKLETIAKLKEKGCPIECIYQEQLDKILAEYNHE